MQTKEVIHLARKVLLTESEAVLNAANLLEKSFFFAFQSILACKGKVILTGIGKSGYIAQKIASTLSSTGTPAVFVHPSEALHGDFGMISEGDCLLAISYGGETRELLAVVKYAKELNIGTIAITGKLHSSLAKLADHVVDGSVLTEADTLGLAPTSSSTVALALGDALAVTVMQARGITREKFASLHPGGSLGRDLAKIIDFMRPLSEVGVVVSDSGFNLILESIAKLNFGIVPVVDKSSSSLIGCISDGDLRRCLLLFGAETLAMQANQLMTSNPKVILSTARAIEAIGIMEEFKITSLFIVNEKQELLGFVRLHDLISAKII